MTKHQKLFTLQMVCLLNSTFINSVYVSIVLFTGIVPFHGYSLFRKCIPPTCMCLEEFVNFVLVDTLFDLQAWTKHTHSLTHMHSPTHMHTCSLMHIHTHSHTCTHTHSHTCTYTHPPTCTHSHLLP